MALSNYENKPNVVICPKCKQELPEDSQFCHFCGVNLRMVISTSMDSRSHEKMIESSSYDTYSQSEYARKKKKPNGETEDEQSILGSNKFGESRIQTRIILEKEKPFWRIAAIFFALLLISSVIVHVYVFSNWQPKNAIQAAEGSKHSLINDQASYVDLDNKNQLLNERISELEEELTWYKNEIEFIDEFVVFVEDNGTNYYHKYECSSFVGDYFWAFNVDAALDEGYTPCPFCCR